MAQFNMLVLTYKALRSYHGGGNMEWGANLSKIVAFHSRRPIMP